ncbi:unnamed protein product [Adineta ricciae]|uniref:USP domain-containing protein n=1 Tax=Adineta ricciae TaxID=249248 RepID=A0A814F402_ADIRI|nr:unnamed protein product [Adineta ricciae]
MAHNGHSSAVSTSNLPDDQQNSKLPNTIGKPTWYHDEQNVNTGKPKSPDPSYERSTGNIHDSMKAMIGETLIYNQQQCIFKGTHPCRNKTFYVLENERAMTGYDGTCPECYQSLSYFTDRRKGFFISEKSFNDAMRKHKSGMEQSKGRNPVNELKTITQKLPPLESPIVGRNKGIAGDSNSCYIDATIFCMFAYNGIFDDLLNMDVPSESLKQLQSVLRDNIVHVLRDEKSGFVERDAVFQLRVRLSEATQDRSFKEVEKDPSEFLRVFEELFKYAPIKTIPRGQVPKPDKSNVTINIIWEMFDANPQNLLSTSIASIFRNSLSEIPAKLATIPPFLILVAPRHKRSERSYRYIIPDRQITLDHDIVQIVCSKCNRTNHDPVTPRDFFFCNKCQPQESTTQLSTDAVIKALCADCLNKMHENLYNEIKNHCTKKVELKKHKLNLFAVLCIETCHYVAFVKCQNRNIQKSTWVFFDSMSDRINDEQNIPLVEEVPYFDQWIDKAEDTSQHFFDYLDNLRRRAGPMSQKFSPDDMRRLRLFRDGAFFFYENANMNYH